MESREQATNIQMTNCRSDFCIKCRSKTGNKNEFVVDKIDKNGCTRKILKSLCVACGSNKGCCMKGSKIVKPTQPCADLASKENHGGDKNKDLYIKVNELPKYLQHIVTSSDSDIYTKQWPANNASS